MPPATRAKSACLARLKTKFQPGVSSDLDKPPARRGWNVQISLTDLDPLLQSWDPFILTFIV